MVTKIILVMILLCSMIIPVGGFLLSKRKKGGFKAALASNLFFFFGTVLVADILLFSGNVQAAGEAAEASVEGWRYLAAALSTGLSCIGAGIAVASAASAALGALSEDSSIMGKALIFVALAESIALYGLLISFSILG
ncbi:MAG: ATPase [Lachnospiraceae bacterium]|jgi:V/A-type H+-transporting ATPase subunit K|nr:ATPase [Lachnospiraceae bacterium]MCI9059692.1 ATPase [Lachnospiraceae bacterium]